MVVLAVLRKPLAMVRQHRDERLVGSGVLRNGREQSPQLLVGVGYLSVVEPVAVCFAEGRGRVVGRMRIEDVHPEEEPPAGARCQPRGRAIHYLARPPFGIFALQLAAAFLRHFIVVNRESAVESKLAFQHRRPDKRRRIPSLLVQDRSQSGMRSVQDETARVADLVPRRVEPGEDAGMRRRRKWGGGDGVLKQHAFASEAVESGRLDFRIAVAAQAVGPQGVDGEQDEIQTPRRLGSFLRSCGLSSALGNRRFTRRVTCREEQRNSQGQTADGTTLPEYNSRPSCPLSAIVVRQQYAVERKCLGGWMRDPRSNRPRSRPVGATRWGSGALVARWVTRPSK